MADSTIDYAAYIAGLVEKGHAAQKIAEGYSQERVDELCEAIAYALTIPETALEFGEKLVAESGMGIAKDKQAKMYGKVKGSWAQMKGQKSVGLIDSNKETGIDTYARPMGVIGAIIPVTNGEATPVVKSLMAIKTRNAVILAPHPKARKVNLEVTNAVRAVLKKFDAPEDLVQAIEPEYVSVEASQQLMKQVDFILATGGTPMVRQAYSSGNPAIGVGTGNVVCIVDETADLPKAADMILRSKAFDNATSCSTENNIIVFEEIYDKWAEEMAKVGAVLIKEGTGDKEKILKALWPESPANHDLSRTLVARPATDIAAAAGVDVPANTKLIMVEENGGYGNDFPFTGEKLSPVAGIRKAKDFEDALEKMQKILDYQGKGHSVSIHTVKDERVTKMGEIIPVCKIVVNQPQSLTNSGSWTCGYPVSMTLGCGTWGHNSISHNATWKDLLNFVYVSREIPNWQPKDEDLFSEKIRNAFN
ncbi:MAG: aldehyde dehydrogenase family protein [Clostridiales Family XIII bacterium]|jgi:sulfoacetaldehyde dehydrogenase|nr:aldehyde dehydrogenase family protein [Clostridiales Family XIII bacterium]